MTGPVRVTSIRHRHGQLGNTLLRPTGRSVIEWYIRVSGSTAGLTDRTDEWMISVWRFSMKSEGPIHACVCVWGVF